MEQTISKKWYLILIKGFIMILLGLLFIISPANALLTYALWIGLGFSVSAVIRIVQGISAKNANESWAWVIFEGSIDLLMGFIFLTHPGLTVAILPFFIGFWATIMAIFLIIEGFSGARSSAIKIITGFSVLLVGFKCMFNPIAAGMTIAVWIGVVFLVIGIYNVVLSFSLR